MLRCLNGGLICVWTEKSDCRPSIISSLTAQKFIHKGVEAFLAYILNTRALESEINQVPTVREFMDVFPKELLSLPPKRELEFVIHVIPGTTPKSIAPYRMAPTELKELKTQLQKLLDRGFIRPRELLSYLLRKKMVP